MNDRHAPLIIGMQEPTVISGFIMQVPAVTAQKIEALMTRCVCIPASILGTVEQLLCAVPGLRAYGHT
jgi:hypothetical protein